MSRETDSDLLRGWQTATLHFFKTFKMPTEAALGQVCSELIALDCRRNIHIQIFPNSPERMLEVSIVYSNKKSQEALELLELVDQTISGILSEANECPDEP